MISQSTDEKAKLESVFYMTTQAAPIKVKPCFCTSWISYITSLFFVISTSFTFIYLLLIIYSNNHFTIQQIFIEPLLKWLSL